MGKHSIEDDGSLSQEQAASLVSLVESKTPTQVEHKWKATARSAFQVIVALAALMPVLVPALGLSVSVGVGAGVLAVAAAVTRVMAIPAVNGFIDRFLPWLRAR